MPARLQREPTPLRKQVRSLTRANRQLEQKILELYTLYNVSKALSLSLQLDDLFEVAAGLLRNSLQVEEYCLLLLDERKQELAIRAAYGLPEEVVQKVRFRLGEGVTGRVAQTGRPALINDVTREARFLFYKGMKQDIGSFLSVPLRIGGNGVIGVLNCHKRQKHAFRKRDLELFMRIAEHVAVAIENALVYQRTRELTNKDPLTGLYNRRYFFERLDKEVARAERYSRVFSLVMMDIDHFKIFNDRNGHLRGDEVLREVTRILGAQLRASDVLARFGGEEFVALLPETGKPASIQTAEKLRRAVEGQLFPGAEGQPGGKLTLTFGIATFPEDAEDALQTLHYSDKALYLGKSRGRNQVCAEVLPAASKS